jgi:tRNA pseudouridine38-40 synthase
MMRIAMGIEYNGTSFKGWQKQSHDCSVQAALEQALSRLSNESIHITCAGRTDAGVHALCQVVHFDCQNERLEHAWIFGTNRYLPKTIRVLWMRKVTDQFDARRTAIQRHYRYIIYNHPIRASLFKDFMGWCYRKLDINRMQAAVPYWIGEHDFSSFRSAHCQSATPMRKVHHISLHQMQDQIIIDMVANAFLHHMVRNMVGTLMSIGAGLQAPEWAKTVLEAKDRRVATVTAPASGLYLAAVYYPDHFGLPIGTPVLSGFVC